MEGNWTLRQRDTSPTVWSFRLLDTSPTGQFAYETFRLLDSSPIGPFAYKTFRLLPGQFATDCPLQISDCILFW